MTSLNSPRRTATASYLVRRTTLAHIDRWAVGAVLPRSLQYTESRHLDTITRRALIQFKTLRIASRQHKRLQRHERAPGAACGHQVRNTVPFPTLTLLGEALIPSPKQICYPCNHSACLRVCENKLSGFVGHSINVSRSIYCRPAGCCCGIWAWPLGVGAMPGPPST